jgi:hypothetical protein
MTKNMKKTSIASACALSISVMAAHASLNYQLNQSIGIGSVTGTITTDGTFGVLSSGNITDWNLVINNGSATFDLLGPLSGNNSAIYLVGSDLTATSANLLFNFSDSTPGAGLLLQNPYIGSDENWFAVEAALDGVGGVASSENLVVGVGTGSQQSFVQTGVEPIASVPEPTTLALVGLSGLATFMGIRRRK